MWKKIKRFYNYIVKVIQYAWFLRNDYDWDYSYILSMLQYKIMRTRKYIETKGSHMDASKEIEDMKRAEYLLEKIIKEDFAEDLYQEHIKKYGKPSYTFPVKQINGKEYFKLEYKYENVLTEEDRKNEQIDFRLMRELAEKRKNEAMDELFSLLRNKIEYWWD